MSVKDGGLAAAFTSTVATHHEHHHPSTAHALDHHVPWSAPAARWARWSAPAVVRPAEAAATRVPSVSGSNDYAALRPTPDDRIGWSKGRLVFVHDPDGRRALDAGPNGSQRARRACPSNRRCGRLRAVWWRTPRGLLCATVDGLG